MEVENVYRYEPLNEPDKTIRLVKIFSIAPQIMCTFSIVSLKDLPVFSALSYMWGTATITESVIVDGGTIDVTVNLAQAIRDIYRHWSKGHLCAPGEEQWLWADALCINQEDVQEKNHQVPLMETIFTGAHRVISWLGPANGKASEGVGTFQLILDAISKLSGHDVLHEETSQGLLPGESRIEAIGKELEDEGLNNITDLEWLKRHYDIENKPEEATTIFDKVYGFFYLPYWSRLWIVQELVLARDLNLVCGTIILNWQSVCKVMLWMRLIKSKFPLGDAVPQGISNLDWLALSRVQLPSKYLHINIVRNARINGLIHSQRALDYSSPEVGVADTFAMYRTDIGYALGRFMSGVQATNPKDYVYGLGGVTEIRMPVDYSTDTTVSQVYQKYVSYWLTELVRERQSTDWDATDSVCEELWFLDTAGVGFCWEAVPGLPSWAPNFSGVAEMERTEDNSYRRKRFSSSSGHSDKGVFALATPVSKVEGSVLHCSAVATGEILATGPIIHIENPLDGPNLESDLWLLWIFDFAAAFRKVDSPAEPPLSMVTRLLCHTSRSGTTSEETFHLNFKLLLMDLMHACKKRRGMLPETFFGQLCMDTRLIPAFALQADAMEGQRTERQMKVATLWAGIDIQQKWFSLATIRNYVEDLNFAESFRMGFTDSGFLGLFPSSIETGDVVCVLKGFTIPVVLRKSGDGYIHVGACYVHGLMNGEAAGMLQDGRAKVEEIKIY